MHSPRSTAAVRPSSPLSPRFDASPRYHHNLQSPCPRSFNPRSQTTQQRRQQGSSLALPALPKFHPANFPSAHSSIANTPGSGPTSPHAPISPQVHQKFYSDAQRQLYVYQQETLARSASRSSTRQEPDSPKLVPLGSPGPVTPFELEGHDSYLTAGSVPPHGSSTNVVSTEELTQKLTQAAKQQEKSPRLSSTSLREQ